MGLETATRIPDLDSAWPLGTDPKSEAAPTGAGPGHLNILKAAVQGSFPGIGNGQVAATAEELDLAITSMQTDVSVIDALADVDTASVPPTDGDVLVWESPNWKPETPVAILQGAAQYSGSTLSGNQVYFPVQVANTIPAGLATIDNTGATRGWTLTAVMDCYVDVSFSHGYTTGASGTLDWVSVNTALGRDTAAGVYADDLGADSVAVFRHNNDVIQLKPSVGASVLLLAGETITACSILSNAGDVTLTPAGQLTCTAREA